MDRRFQMLMPIVLMDDGADIAIWIDDLSTSEAQLWPWR